MFFVDRKTCIACQQCIKDCPARVISLEAGKAEIHNQGCIKCGHCIAICPVKAVATDDYDMEEVLPYDKEAFTIEADRLMNFIKFRRSVRRFKKTSIDKETLMKVIEAGRYTQTSTNSQDVSYTVLTDKLDEIKTMIYTSLKAKGEYLLATMTPQTQHLSRYANLWVNGYDQFVKDPAKNDWIFFHAPAVILVTSPTPINGGLASSNMELMADALGLGTFFSGFFLYAVKDNEELLHLLGIKDGSQIISCMVIGYPDVKYQRTVPRKEAQIHWM